jgi:putative ABC transport system permease protein
MNSFSNAIRSLIAAPRFASLVLLSLFLGLLGLSLAGSVIEHVLLRSLPFSQPEQLVAVREQTKDRVISMTQQNARDLETADTGLAAFSYYSGGPTTTQISGRNWIAQAHMVGADFFRVLRVSPSIGNSFGSASDLDKNASVAMISESFWRSRFAASASIVGQRMQAFGHDVEIIGVVGQAQIFPAGTDVWIPDRIEAINPSRSSHGYQGIGRVRADHSFALAQNKLNVLGKRWKAQNGADMTTDRFPIHDLRDALVGDHAQVLWTTVAAAAFLLLIAGLNASNLFLVHSLSLGQQNATKLGLGAKAQNLALEIFIQAFALSFVGWLLASLGTSLLLNHWQASLQLALPRVEDIGISISVLATMAVVGIGLAFACALLPMRTFFKADVLTSMRQSTRSNSESKISARLRSSLTALQTALTVVMLAGTMLLWQSVQSLLSVNIGFKVDGIAAASVSQNMSDFSDAQTKLPIYARVMDALAQTPGVTHVALSSGLPLSDMGNNGSFLKEMPNARQPLQGDMEQVFARFGTAPANMQGSADFRVVSRDFFAALEIPLQSGRFFADTDTVDRQHVAVISATLAKSSYPAGDALGQKIQFGNMDGDVRQLLIVGIAGDVRGTALDAPADPIVYVHLPQRPLHASNATLILRGDLNIASLQTLLSEELSRVSNLPSEITSLAQLRDQALGIRAPLLKAFAAFMGLAMLLAMIGVYGLVRYNLAQKTRELWVRRALGATPLTLILQQLGKLMRVHLIAVAIGLGLTLLCVKVIASQLYGVTPYDLVTLLSAGIIMAAVCAAAVLLAALATQALRQIDLKML